MSRHCPHRITEPFSGYSLKANGSDYRDTCKGKIYFLSKPDLFKKTLRDEK
jgi:hypothetical protein